MYLNFSIAIAGDNLVIVNPVASNCWKIFLSCICIDELVHFSPIRDAINNDQAFIRTDGNKFWWWAHFAAENVVITFTIFFNKKMPEINTHMMCEIWILPSTKNCLPWTTCFSPSPVAFGIGDLIFGISGSGFTAFIFQTNWMKLWAKTLETENCSREREKGRLFRRRI